MHIDITKSERDVLLHWYDTTKGRANRYGDGNATFPDEARLADLLEAHNGGAFELGLNRILTLLSWAESAVDPNFGRGSITNPVEDSILAKIRLANAKLNSSNQPAPPKPFSGPHDRAPEDESSEKPCHRNMLREGLIALLLFGLVVFGISILFTQNENAPKTAALPSKQTTGPRRPRPQPVHQYSVLSTFGDCSLKTKSGWKKARVRIRLHSGDTVKTGPGSILTLKGFGSDLTIPENHTRALP